jgi:hypothetical protein
MREGKRIGQSWALRPVLAFAALAAGLGGIEGCARQKESSSNAGASALESKTPPGTARSTVTPATVPTPPPAPYGLALADRLTREAAQRPSDTPKAEDVLAAVAKSGVPLAEEAQHLASPVGASFCVGARSPQNVAMSACEYADDAAATAGRDMSRKAFANVLHRDVVLNKKTTLTILQAPFDAQSQAAHDAAVAAFKKL